MSIQGVIDNKRAWHIETGDALESLRQMPSGSVHCLVTSPPYYGLRNYKVDGQIGLESSHLDYIEKLATLFDEAYRVLRDDGTMWVNIGDTYAANWPCPRRSRYGAGSMENGKRDARPPRMGGSLKNKDLIGIPWRLAFALQDRGWYLRSEIIWHKPSAMPESVKDRPSKAHEQIFLFAKSERYFYDHIAVRVAAKASSVARLAQDVENQAGSDRVPGKTNGTMKAVRFGGNKAEGYGTRIHGGKEWNPTMAGGAIGIGDRKNQDANGDPYMTANLRTVWSVTNSGFKGEHYATYPMELVEPMIKAATSEYGVCVDCGTPWERRIESSSDWAERKAGGEVMRPGLEGDTAVNKGMFKSLNPLSECFVKSCKCATDEVRPAIVLDPFSGMATSGIMALRLGRRYIGLELNPEYAEVSRNRILDDAPLFNTLFD